MVKPVVALGNNPMEAQYVQLESALSGLLLRSESDYPLEFVHWQTGSGKKLTADLVRAQLGSPADAKIEEGDPQQLLEQYCKTQPWFGDDEIEMAKGFQKLRALLNQLNNLRMFRVGEVEVAVVLVGEEAGGDIVGFKTISVET